MDTGVDTSTREKDAKVAFILGTFFIAGFSWVAVSYLGKLPGYLVACAEASPVRDIFSDRAFAGLYWVNVTCSAAYALLFIGWWRRNGRPWRSGDSTSFSRRAWAGLWAWQEAQETLARTIRGGPLSAAQRLEYASLLVLAVLTIATAAIMLSVLVSCDNCHGEWRGRCTSPIAGAVSGVGLMLMYTDMRIKFGKSRRTDDQV